MKNRTSFSYYWKEGFRNIFLHGFMSFAAVSVIIVCLLITGSVTLIAHNISLQIIRLQQESEIVVFIDENITESQRYTLTERLADMENIREARFESRLEALEAYRDALGDNAVILDGFDADNNPLRDAYHITLVDVTRTSATLAQLGALEGIANIRVNEDTISALIKVQNVFQVISYGLLIALGAISIFIISNTVKLAMFTRRDEIAIQKMVGATNWFIRWPFVVEGMLLGLFAGGVVFFAEWVVYSKLAETISAMLPSFSMVEFAEIRLLVLGAFLIAGVIVGVGGSVLTIRRFMDV